MFAGPRDPNARLAVSLARGVIMGMLLRRHAIEREAKAEIEREALRAENEQSAEDARAAAEREPVGESDVSGDDVGDAEGDSAEAEAASESDQSEPKPKRKRWR